MYSNWSLFKSLCRIIGGQDRKALTVALKDGLLAQLVDMAWQQDILPALATRVDEQPDIKDSLDEPASLMLQQALQENTGRNMQTVMQALKLARSMNHVGITPTFLKGTAQLLTVNEARLGFRKQLDIDLVVAPEELQATCEVLLGAGYSFYREASNASSQPVVFHDTKQALRESAAHHHLPPMVIEGYANSVEVHRHFLPRRFQRNNPLEGLLATARRHESHGARFRVPSAEYQIIHLVLGKMIRDGHLARRSFPIREGCDYIDAMKNKEEEINEGLVTQHCGKDYAILTQLVKELMAYKDGETKAHSYNIRQRLYLMEKRYNSTPMATLLNAHARVLHLGNELLSSPTKLPGYLRRLGRN